MFLILSWKRSKTLIAGITLACMLSSCSGRKNAVCDGSEHFNIYYSPKHYQQLVETKNCVDCELNGTNVDLSNLDLTNADLSGTGLAGANLSGTKLTNANLSQVSLYDYDAGFFGSTTTCTANLDRVDLRGANLSGAIMPDGSVHE